MQLLVNIVNVTDVDNVHCLRFTCIVNNRFLMNMNVHSGTSYRCAGMTCLLWHCWLGHLTR